ncbi:MAG TPA: DNA polymerase Y family protein, partial [Terrimesophilobacter sp.]|nr:DNA polymerase Y family protein [Terrimesophilobacter sp.]
PERPWPGRLPPLSPTTVYRPPHPVTVFAGDGSEVGVDDRGILTAPPVSMSGSRGTLRIHAWAGPWAVTERWWDADTASHAHRFQVVDANGTAWLLGLHQNSWWLEARYD